MQKYSWQICKIVPLYHHILLHFKEHYFSIFKAIQYVLLISDPNAMHEPVAGVIQVELDMLFKKEEYEALRAA